VLSAYTKEHAFVLVSAIKTALVNLMLCSTNQHNLSCRLARNFCLLAKCMPGSVLARSLAVEVAYLATTSEVTDN